MQLQFICVYFSEPPFNYILYILYFVMSKKINLNSNKLFLDLGIVISISDGIVGISGLDNVANVKLSSF